MGSSCRPRSLVVHVPTKVVPRPFTFRTEVVDGGLVPRVTQIRSDRERPTPRRTTLPKGKDLFLSFRVLSTKNWVRRRRTDLSSTLRTSTPSTRHRYSNFRYTISVISSSSDPGTTVRTRWRTWNLEDVDLKRDTVFLLGKNRFGENRFGGEQCKIQQTSVYVRSNYLTGCNRGSGGLSRDPRELSVCRPFGPCVRRGKTKGQGGSTIRPESPPVVLSR